VLIQQVENNFLVPRIMGQSLKLHPLFVLVGVVVGASFAGVLGAFLAAPVLASLKVLGMYAHAKIIDLDPMAQPPVTVDAKAQPRASLWRRFRDWRDQRSRSGRPAPDGAEPGSDVHLGEVPAALSGAQENKEMS
jgi:hypothetical protein